MVESVTRVPLLLMCCARCTGSFVARHLGGCQNYGPFLGILNLRCRIIIGIQTGTIILTITPFGTRCLRKAPGLKDLDCSENRLDDDRAKIVVEAHERVIQLTGISCLPDSMVAFNGGFRKLGAPFWGST